MTEQWKWLVVGVRVVFLGRVAGKVVEVDWGYAPGSNTPFIRVEWDAQLLGTSEWVPAYGFAPE